MLLLRLAQLDFVLTRPVAQQTRTQSAHLPVCCAQPQQMSALSVLPMVMLRLPNRPPAKSKKLAQLRLGLARLSAVTLVKLTSGLPLVPQLASALALEPLERAANVLLQVTATLVVLLGSIAIPWWDLATRSNAMSPLLVPVRYRLVT